MSRFVAGFAIASFCALAAGCDGCTQEKRESRRTDHIDCPARANAPALLSGVEGKHRTLQYWLTRLDESYGGADRVVMSGAQMNAYNRERPEHDLGAAPRWDWIRDEVRRQLGAMKRQVQSEELVLANGEALRPEQQMAFNMPRLQLQTQLVRADKDIAMRCAPLRAALLKRADPDARFDRNLCNTVRSGEPMRLLARVGAFWLAETDYTWGFVQDDEFESLKQYRVPSVEMGLTRARLFEAAFSHLGEPYGWGGFDGGRDCSRLVFDSFAAQGLRVPRNSGPQSQAGVRTLSTLPHDADARVALIDEAARRGAVLLHLPGHIMLYLGRSEQGEPMVIHAFAAYEKPCRGGAGKTRFEVHRTEVSTLRLGEGSEQGSLLERIDQLTVFEPQPR